MEGQVVSERKPYTEEQAIAALKRVAKRWPKTLWVFAGNGDLAILRAGPDGEHVHNESGSVDQAYIVDSVDIPNDGGGW
jgi:hypothetical protein